MAHHIDGSGKARRARAKQVLRPPEPQHGVLDDQCHAEGGEQLEQLGRGVDAAQERHLERGAGQPDDQRGRREPAPEAERAAAEGLDQREGQIGPQHE